MAAGYSALSEAIEILLNDYSKFIGMTSDLHDIAVFLNHIRWCFIVLTASGYVGIIIYTIFMLRQKVSDADSRKQRDDSTRRRRHELFNMSRDWEMQGVTVDDGYGSAGSRAAHKPAPSSPRRVFTDPLSIQVARHISSPTNPLPYNRPTMEVLTEKQRRSHPGDHRPTFVLDDDRHTPVHFEADERE